MNDFLDPKRKQKWVKKNAITIIGIGILIIAIVLFFLTRNSDRIVEDFAPNLTTELFSIAITVIIIDRLYALRQREETRERLIRDLLSRVTDSAVRAVDELRHYGWLDEVLQEYSFQLSSINLEGADLWSANLQGTYLLEANLEGADLQQANLREATLCSANLEGTDLSEANLEGADLQQANLERVDLSSANLKEANLFDANLKGANLSSANLKEAHLAYANLEGADLSHADLEGANLFDANLKGANLVFANLINIKPFDRIQLSRAKKLHFVILPDGVMYRFIYYQK